MKIDRHQDGSILVHKTTTLGPTTFMSNASSMKVDNYMWAGKVSELPMPMDERKKINETIQRLNGMIDIINEMAQQIQETSRVIDILKQSEALRALVNIEKPTTDNAGGSYSVGRI